MKTGQSEIPIFALLSTSPVSLSMQPDPRIVLTHIEQAGADIESFTDGMDAVAYTDDARTQAAVERKFEIIGEAVNRLP